MHIDARPTTATTSGSSDSRLNPVLENDFASTYTNFFPFAIDTVNSAAKYTGSQQNANHPGVIALWSSTTANSGFYIYTDDMFIIGGDYSYDAVLYLGTLTGMAIKVGFVGNLYSATVDGVWIGIAAGVITGNTSSNSTASATATIYTGTTATWYHLRITVNAAASSVLYEVYSDAGTLLGSASLTTNIPTGAGRYLAAGASVLNSGTTAVEICQIDYIRAKMGTPTRGALA